MLHPAANRHPKATHQWLLMGVQACRLPALKSLKPLKPLKPWNTLKTLETLTTRNGGPSLPFARPQTLTLKTLKTLQTVQKLLGTPNRAGNSAAPRPRRLNIPLACFILQPTGTPRPHINGFLWVSKPAVFSLTPLKPLKNFQNPASPYKPSWGSKPAVCQALHAYP